ncbi:MAG: pyridoxal phosphate-dependent aminotransferase [Oscillospiraceae bacterium]|nr:pyridoxal phosphate-dependent aminotransferase [Oscillospiraceae bacterium]
MFNEEAYALGANRSCIRELFEYGRSRAAQIGAENVYDFSLGNPSIPAPAGVRDTIAQLLEDTDSVQLHGYTTAVGDLQTRQAIAEDLNCRYGTDITASELFIGCGAAPELCAVFKALAFPGAKILALAPYFPEYKPFVESAGAVFQAVAPDVPDFQINLSELEKCLTADTAAVIVNSPNNPSGTVYTENTLKQLAALLERKSEAFGHPIYIVADEPYRELVYGGVTAPFIPSIYRNTLVCYSYSKSLSLPGERIGYIYVPRLSDDADKLYLAVAGAARSLGHVCAPSLWQKVIARCARLRPDLQAYDKNRTALYEGLVAAGYEVAKPDGAFYLFVKAPGGDANAFSQFAKEKDILLVPGDGFGCPGWFRLCYCVSYGQITRSLPVFRALFEQWKQRK